MITKEQYIKNFLFEIQIIKHLAGKIDPATLEYRPSEKQRSMLDLLKYLGHIIATGITISIEGNSGVFAERAKAGDSITLENFAEKMDEQASFMEERVGALSDEDLAKETAMFGTVAPCSTHLLNVLKWAVAYKMQLFLYIKANGNHSISTSNVWGGRDMPPKA